MRGRFQEKRESEERMERKKAGCKRAKDQGMESRKRKGETIKV